MMSINPYWGMNFFQFFSLLFSRLLQLMQGKIAFSDLAPDEVQIIVLALVALSCSLVGCLLVVKKMTMVANSLSHTLLLGLIVALIMQGKKSSFYSSLLDIKILLIASFLTAFFTYFLTEILSRYLKVQRDASIGLIFTSLFALGVVLLTFFSRNSFLAEQIVMGSADLIYYEDVFLALASFLLNLIFLFLFFRPFELAAFDSTLVKGFFGLSPFLFDLLLMLQTSFTIVLAFRVVGVILVLSFLVTPALLARPFSKNLKEMLFFSCGFSLVGVFVGVALTRHVLSVHKLPLSTGAMIAVVLSLLFLLVLFGKGKITSSRKTIALAKKGKSL